MTQTVQGTIKAISPYGIRLDNNTDWINCAFSMQTMQANIHKIKEEWIGNDVSLTLDDKGKYVAIQTMKSAENKPGNSKDIQIRRLSLIKSAAEIITSSPYMEKEALPDIADMTIELARRFEKYIEE